MATSSVVFIVDIDIRPLLDKIPLNLVVPRSQPWVERLSVERFESLPCCVVGVKVLAAVARDDITARVIVRPTDPFQSAGFNV
eukprot:CAMPEP_0119468600 /NCGR_PEP_ID=MMETSP1344-20130328/2284_1 /TAXON_ID=236787 /ORGANISM="Florenciella parvula, Strain CCMP2471" /LENGTH=82 /DNA_ID=CAMNT_0007501081 /DNA_START=910 /DNA_END=1158 /DNA_ORIENTATION=-